MKEHIQSARDRMKHNVGTTERVISGLAGFLLTYSALKKGKPLRALAGTFLLFRGTTGYCPGYDTLGKNSTGHPRNINIKTSVTVNKPVHEVYDFWRKLENLPLFMKHIKSVSRIDDKTSEWKARIPGGIGSLSWKSEIVEDQKNERIGWRSLPGFTIENAGNVQFRDAGKFGTEVYAIISYHAPAGKIGEGVGRLFNPLFEEMVKEDIKNFKRYMEGGELPTIEGQPKGK